MKRDLGRHVAGDRTIAMNPWRKNILDICRNTIRFVLWTCFALVTLMTAVFSVRFCYEFYMCLWSWCARVLFSSPW